MDAARRSHCIQLAKSLPPQLLRFFARYPPRPLIQPIPQNTPSTIQKLQLSPLENTQVYNEAEGIETFLNRYMKNPFEFRRVGRSIVDPVYSTRRQADLVKLARKHGVEDLLPDTPKKTEARIQKRAEEGLRVRGTGIGQKVKGHKHERTLKERLAARRQAMLKMPLLVREWKQKGHGRGWTKWPK